MTDEARNFLDLLDHILAKGDKTAHEVHAVVTALRSMDGGGGALKDCACVPIRRKALPKCTAVAEGETPLEVNAVAVRMALRVKHPDDANKVDLRSITRQPRRTSYGFKELTNAESHYVGHVQEAARALGLTVVQ